MCLHASLPVMAAGNGPGKRGTPSEERFFTDARLINAANGLSGVMCTRSALCFTCKTLAHPERTCAQSLARQSAGAQVLALGTRNRWRRCPACGRALPFPLPLACPYRTVPTESHKNL